MTRETDDEFDATLRQLMQRDDAPGPADLALRARRLATSRVATQWRRVERLRRVALTLTVVGVVTMAVYLAPQVKSLWSSMNMGGTGTSILWVSSSNASSAEILTFVAVTAGVLILLTTLVVPALFAGDD